jgi:hypothetical protein
MIGWCREDGVAYQSLVNEISAEEVRTPRVVKGSCFLLKTILQRGQLVSGLGSNVIPSSLSILKFLVILKIRKIRKRDPHYASS